MKTNLEDLKSKKMEVAPLLAMAGRAAASYVAGKVIETALDSATSSSDNDTTDTDTDIDNGVDFGVEDSAFEGKFSAIAKGLKVAISKASKILMSVWRVLPKKELVDLIRSTSTEVGEDTKKGKALSLIAGGIESVSDQEWKNKKIEDKASTLIKVARNSGVSLQDLKDCIKALSTKNNTKNVDPKEVHESAKVIKKMFLKVECKYLINITRNAKFGYRQ